MKPSLQARCSHPHDRQKTNRTKSHSLLVTACLLFLLVGMTVTVVGRDRHNFPSLEDSHPIGVSQLFLLARRYGVAEAVNFSFQIQEEAAARREMERIKQAERRDEELRKKVTELAQTSIELYKRFENPSEVHADTPQLAQRCEELAKAIKKLLR